MKIVILEDNQIELSLIKEALNEGVIGSNIELSITTFHSGEELFGDDSALKQSIDLFLLDIEMGEMNGIDVAKKLRISGYKGDIIFLTAFRDFVFEGYNVHAFNYLVKPLDKAVFFKCLTEIESKRHANCYIYRNKQQESIAIPYPEIISFSVNRHYVDIATADKTFEQYINLNALINLLPNQFVQVHRSCIINLAHVYKFSQNKVYLSNSTNIEVGRTYLKKFKQQYLDYSTRFNRNGDFYNDSAYEHNSKPSFLND